MRRPRDLVDDINSSIDEKMRRAQALKYPWEDHKFKYELDETIVECDNCGKVFDKPQRCLDRTKKDYCSRKCYKESLNPLKSSLRKRIRNSVKYNRWRNRVLRRDNYTCQECGLREDQHVHHIEHFTKILNNFLYDYSQFDIAEDKETLLKLSFQYKSFWKVKNGITLCKECHKIKHTRG